MQKLPKWLRWLLISVGLFLCSTMVAFIAEEVLHLDLQNTPHFLDKVFTGLIIILVFPILAFFSAAVVSLIKLLIAKSTAKYTPPETTDEIPRKHSEKINVRRLYEADHVLRFRNAREPMTWPLVCMGLVVLCPFGIFLTIRKVVEEKTRYYENGISMIIIGAVPIVFTIWVPISFFVHDEFDWMSVVFLLPTLLGMLMILFGIVVWRKGKTNNDYMIILKVDQVTRLDDIARLMKTDYAHATNVIQNMIDNDLLRGAYIHHTDREVILPGISEKIALCCRSCGATTVLYSTDEHVCAYCGAEI